MTLRACIECAHPATAGETACSVCGGLVDELEPPTEPLDEPAAEPTDPEPAGSAPGAAGPLCVHCGSPVGPAEPLCPACGQSPAPSVTALRVRFETAAGAEPYVLTLRRGEQAMLGRDPGISEHAEFLGGFPNVSRRHARLRLDLEGRAWIIDEYSTNWTQRNSERLVPGQEVALRDKDRIRLGATLSGRIGLVIGDVAESADQVAS